MNNSNMPVHCIGTRSSKNIRLSIRNGVCRLEPLHNDDASEYTRMTCSLELYL